MSKATMDEVWGPIEAHNKSIVMHNTWGHLFPKKDYYEGKVRVAKTIYGQTDVIDENDDLPGSSPWWFDAINEFAYKMDADMKDGEVAEFNISVKIVQCEEELEDWQVEEGYKPDTWQEIHINQLRKTILVEAY